MVLRSFLDINTQIYMKVKPQPDLLSAVGSPNRVPRRRGVTHVLGRGGRQLPEGEWS